MLERESYINEKIDIDYIVKSKNSSLAFGLVAVVFLLLHANSKMQFGFAILSIFIVILSVLRIHNVRRFLNNQISRDIATRNVSISGLINGLLWSAIGFISLMMIDELSINVMITFIILLAFISGSVVTLSSKKKILIFFNIIMLTPIAYYALMLIVKTGSKEGYFLLAFSCIKFLYVLKQSKVISSELRRRICIEFDLIKSLEELAVSKTTLEQESIKTFHASRLSSLGEMAGGVAHEINNPLTIIQGLSNKILNDDLTIDPIVREKLAKIHSASERIAKIVKGMKLISSKNDRLEHESVSIDKILEISTALFEERLKNERISFECVNLSNPVCKCNSLQVSQIIINLLSNAVDAINSSEDEKFIKLFVDVFGENLHIRVINSGPLLSSEVARKMFEPFFSTKSLGKGTGLGLSISQTLAQSNGGSLDYEPYEGHISFVLRLKIAS